MYILPLGKLLPMPHRGQKVKFGPKLDFFNIVLCTGCQNVLFFCMKLDNNKTFQTMYLLTSRKLSARPSRGQKVKFWAQNCLFQKYLLNHVPDFFDVCLKLDTNKTLRTMYMLPSRKLLPRCDGGQKVKFGLKMDFFKIIF